MADFLINAGLLAVILISSALATNLYVKWAYNRCAACGALNAKRRSRCRTCSEPVGG
jgi:hypothetical protein